MSDVFFRRLLSFFTCLFMVLALVIGCSDDDDDSSTGPGDEVEYPVLVVFKGDSTTVDLGDLPTETIEGEEVVDVIGLVDSTEVVDTINYAYRFIGSDGFCAHIKGDPDNTWEHMHNGYIVLSNMRVMFDPGFGLANRYNVTGVATLEILRKIDFVTPADSLIQYSIDDLTQVPFNAQTGVKMTDLIPAELIPDPAAYSYQLVASDGYAKTATYAQYNEAYYVIE